MREETPPTPPPKDDSFSHSPRYNRLPASSSAPLHRAALTPTLSSNRKPRDPLESLEIQRLDLEKAKHEEEERQARLKQQKQEELEEYLEAERRRKLLLETELRCAALAKRRKAEQERIFEEEWNKSMEERRAQARRKWHQGSAERSRWRAQRAKEMENSTHVKLETRQKLWEERKSRPLPAAKSHHSVILGCWVSTQSQLTTVWKRRFCRLNADGLRLYASADNPAEVNYIPFLSIQSVSDGTDSEELQLLPNAFALNLKGDDGVEPFVILADCLEQKEELISGIVQMAEVEVN